MSETPRETPLQLAHRISDFVEENEDGYWIDAIEDEVTKRDAATFAAALRMAADAVRSVIPKFQLQETRRPTIAELEAIINEPEPIEPISIQPDGSVIAGEPIWVGWCMEAILAFLPSDMAAAEAEREKKLSEALMQIAALKDEKLGDKFTYCAYCGHTEPTDVDGEVIASHIRQCEKHPLNIELIKVRAELSKLKEKLS